MKAEIKEEFLRLKGLDKKVLIIFLSVAVIQTISWYYTSKFFFRINLYQFFRENPQVNLLQYVYWFLGDTFSFFILPVIIISFLLKEKISNYGLKAGDSNFGLKISLAVIIFMLIAVWFISSSNTFYLTYPYLGEARENWTVFFIFEILLFVYIFSWEFIWRGFMLFGLEPKFGYYSIFIQMIPFVILHNGKPVLETFSAIIGGILLGILAIKTRSILYGVLIHCSLIFSMDLISTLRYRANEFGIGINSFFNLFK